MKIAEELGSRSRTVFKLGNLFIVPLTQNRQLKIIHFGSLTVMCGILRLEDSQHYMLIAKIVSS